MLLTELICIFVKTTGTFTLHVLFLTKVANLVIFRSWSKTSVVLITSPFKIQSSFFRFNRVGARVKSEADMEEIMDNLQEQAMEDKKMRSYAVIPPILLDAKERKITYQNNNGHVEDMEAVYRSRKHMNIWTQSEKEIFKEKYLQHPKNFGVIASYLDRKTVSDCVQYYYLSKKTENYKQLLRKSRLRARSRNNPQKVNSSANTSVVAVLLTSGVTTRLQREQQQKTVGQSRDMQDALPASTSTTCTTSTTTSSTECPSSSATTFTVCNATNAAASPTPTSSSSSVISGTTTMLTSTTTITAVAAPTPSEAKSPAVAENPPSEEKGLSDVSGKFFGEEGKSDSGGFEGSAGDNQTQKDADVTQEAVR